MAQKLLPEVKKSSITKIDSKNLFGGSRIQATPKKISASSLRTKEKSGESDENKLESILNSLISIDKIVKTFSKLYQKQNLRSKREEENLKRKKKEDELEKGKDKEDKKKLPGISIPGKSIFDGIVKFLLYALLARTFLKYKDSIPKLGWLAETVGSIAESTINMFGSILNGLVSFVDWGIKAYDKVEEFIDNVGGDGVQNAFSGFMGGLEKVFDAALIAALALGDLGGDDGKGPGREDVTGIRGSRTTPGRSRYGTSSQAARRYAQRFGRDAAARRFGQEGVRSLGGKYARSGVTNLARKGVVGLLGKGGTKTALRIVKPLVKNIPLIGGIMEFVLSWLSGDKPAKAAFKGVGAGFGTWIGGALGSLIPIPGVGTAIGMYIGSEGGSALGGLLYDKIFGDKDPSNNNKVQGRAEGGPVTRGGREVGVVRRQISVRTVPKRIISINPEPVEPGKDVGGKEKIKQVYQDKNENTIGEEESTYDYLEKTTNELGKTRFFGPLFSIALKTILGDRPSTNDYKIAGLSLDGWIGTEFEKYGITPADYSQVISKSLEDSISSEVDRALRELQSQFTSLRGTGRPSDVSSPSSDLPVGTPSLKGNTNAEKVFNYLVEQGFTEQAAAGIIGNLMQESGVNPSSHQKGGAGRGIMQWGTGAGSGGRWDALVTWAQSAGKDPWKLETQVQWMMKEMKDYGTLNRIKGMTNVKAAVDLFEDEMEKAGTPMMQNRYQYAADALASFGKGGAARPGAPSTNIQLGAGYGSDGSKIAGELGRFIKSKLKSPEQFSQVHRHPEHPPYSLTSGHSKGSLHYQGRAVDIGANDHEQQPVLDAIAEFNKIKGVKPVQLYHAGNDSDHKDHVHVAYQDGGLIGKPKVKTPSVNSFTSYNMPGGNVMVQPVIYTKTKYIPYGGSGGSGGYSSGGLNINNNQIALSRG